MAEIRYAVVTGGNKGIGFEICRGLALNGIHVILTSRNESRGLEAVEKLKASGLLNVVFHQLDIKDPSSIEDLAEFIKTRYKKLDILINNAGELGITLKNDQKFRDAGGFMLMMDENNVHFLSDIIEESYEAGEQCLQTNYYGSKRTTEALVPLLHLSESPRIVNVSSIFGELQWFPNGKLKEELLDIENVTEERIDEIIKWFLKEFKASKLQENGCPLTSSAYRVSKAALNLYTLLMARKYQNILVNSVCPGYVVTDLTYNMGFLTTKEGAKGPIMAALLPDDGPSGVYFRDMKITPF